MKALLLTLLISAAALFTQAQTSLADADKLFEQKEYVKAFELYDHNSSKIEKDVKHLRRAAFCLLNCENQEMKAISYLKKAYALDAADPLTNYYLGIAYRDAAKAPGNLTEVDKLNAKAKEHLAKSAAAGNADAKEALVVL